MNKANIILGVIVLSLGVVAGVMVLAPDILNNLTKPSVKPGANYVYKPAPYAARAQSETVEQSGNPAVQSTSTSPDQTSPVESAGMGAGQTTEPSAGQEQSTPAEIRPDFSLKGTNVTTIKTEDFQDWRVECGELEAGKTVCNMYQRLAWQEDKNIQALMVMIGIAEREGKPVPRMRLIVPLGTFLPSGLILAIEDEQEANVPFQFCAPEGCVINLDMADDVIEKLKAKGSLKVGYLRPDRQMAKLEISLKGFTKALERIAAP